MVGEGALRRGRLGHDVAHAGADIALAEHDLEAGVENVVAMRCFCHSAAIRTYVLFVKAVFPDLEEGGPPSYVGAFSQCETCFTRPVSALTAAASNPRNR